MENLTQSSRSYLATLSLTCSPTVLQGVPSKEHHWESTLRCIKEERKTMFHSTICITLKDPTQRRKNLKFNFPSAPNSFSNSINLCVCNSSVTNL